MLVTLRVSRLTITTHKIIKDTINTYGNIGVGTGGQEGFEFVPTPMYGNKCSILHHACRPPFPGYTDPQCNTTWIYILPTIRQ